MLLAITHSLEVQCDRWGGRLKARRRGCTMRMHLDFEYDYIYWLELDEIGRLC